MRTKLEEEAAARREHHYAILALSVGVGVLAAALTLCALVPVLFLRRRPTGGGSPRFSSRSGWSQP